MELKVLKQRAVELAVKLPWQETADSPTIRYYTDWAKFEGYQPLTERPVPSVSPDSCEVIVIDGVLAGAGACSGVEAGRASEVFRHLEVRSKILALHAAALQEAVYVKVRGRVEPLVVRAVASVAGRHVASHMVLDVEESAEGSIVVQVENGAGAMHTAVVEGEVRGSVEYVLVSRGGGPQYVHSALLVLSSVSARPLVVGGVMNAVREEYIIGEGASAEAVGLELGFGDSRMDHVVSMINDAPRGRSYARLYAVAADRSFVAQRAVGRITPRGVESNSAVEGVVYIAGEGAVASTQPIILVETGEVEGARHSAADAALDEEKEFFLRSRGVRREDLPKLLVMSLVDQYLASLSEPSRKVLETVLKPVLS